MSEKEKMRQGHWYDANHDEELLLAREQTMDLCFELNQLKPSEKEKRKILLRKILGYDSEKLTLLSPFVCDYGKHIHFGKNVFVNINSYFMDGADIFIGDNVFIGPNCGFYTANHHLFYQERNAGQEQALPISIGDNVWLGANVTILPGVQIGCGSVIGAGSVVTESIEPNSIAYGVPCKVKHHLDNERKIV